MSMANKKPAPPPPPPPPAAPAVVEIPHLSQHEQELISLKTGRESFGSYRMPEMGSNNNNNNNKYSVAKPVTTRPTTTTTTIAAAAAVQPTQAICGRFQFRCHSGECIAIYNACDGIPQCEDGSDESSAVIKIKRENFHFSLH